MMKEGLVKEVFKNVCFVRSIKKRTEGRRAEISLFTNQLIKVKIGQCLEHQRFTVSYLFTNQMYKVKVG